MLDVFCGAGGASRGYATAGFAIWGVDNNPRMERDYLKSGAEKFICADALEVLADKSFVRRFDFIHASPPCQHYSQMSRCRPGLADSYPDFIPRVRELLLTAGVPFTIENVNGARAFLLSPMTLCGTMFGKPTYRHRLFEASNGLTLTAPVQLEAVKRNKDCGWGHPVATARAGHWEPGKYVSVSGHERKEPVREAMGIDWMTNREDIKESIPPYMSRYIGQQVLAQL
jgi:DNA (cytosine-5)-methyltransferase 1